MKLLLKIYNIVLNVLIVIVFIFLCFALYNYVQINVLKNRYTNYLGYTFFEIQTGSMEPTINIDDYVFVKITDDIDKDDIISYYSDSSIVTHRVIDIDDNMIYTKGDNNNAVDKPIEKESVIGKVIYIGKDYGKYMNIITEPRVFISFFITVILFNIALSSDKKEVRSHDKKEIQE